VGLTWSIHFLIKISARFTSLNHLLTTYIISEPFILSYEPCMHPMHFQDLPRFQPENLEKNALIFEKVNAMAVRKGCTPSQLALAWVHHQGPDVCPIPGTTKIENFNNNVAALSVKLTPDDMVELESYASVDVQGDRYHDFLNTWKDSETPPLSSWKAE